jgi:hypothetical protein
MVIGDGNTGGLQPMARGYSLQPGQHTNIEIDAYLSNTALKGRVTTASGEPVPVDLSLSLAGEPVAFAGGRDIREGSLLPATGVNHLTTADALGYFYMALPSALSGANLSIASTKDTGRESYTSISKSVIISPSQANDLHFVLGKWRGGGGDDLSHIPHNPHVQFSEVQSIFSNHCIGCHRENTSNNGSLDLTQGRSFSELVNQASYFVPGLKLVDPGNPYRSYLFEKINCATPQQGKRMSPSNAMSLRDQAIIRDWIEQLLPSYQGFVRDTMRATPGSYGTGIAEDYDGDGRANGLVYSSFEPSLISTSGSMPNVYFQINSASTDLTLSIQASNELQSGSWQTLATRLRGETNWRTTHGVTVIQTHDSVIRLNESTLTQTRRFYRTVVSEH